MEEKKRDKRGYLTMAVTILINLIIIAVIASSEFGQDNAGVQQISIADIRVIGLFLAFAAFCTAVYMEYVKYRKMLMGLEGRDDKRGALEVALLGKYYDNVTPFGAGGQPFQMLYLKKRGVSPGTAGALPVVGFLTQQFAFVSVAAVVFIANRSVLSDNALIKGSAYVGMFTYMLVPTAIVLFAVAPNVFKKIVGGGTRLLGKLHILKDAKKTEASVYSALDEYVVSLKNLNSRPHFFFKLLVISIVYQIAIMSIPYFVLLAFRGTEDWWTVFSTVVYIYAAITIIPTPGNSGAAESYFYIAFSSIEGGSPFWAMLVWRGFVYYSWLLCGIIVLMLQKVRFVKPKKKVPEKGRLSVALFNDIHYPSVDGVVRTVDAYARELRADGNYSLCVVPRMDESYVDDRGYEVIRTPSLKLFNFAFYIGLPFIPPGLLDKLRTEGVNVIHAHSPFGIGKMAIKVGKKLKIPVVATFHSKFYDDAYNVTHSKFCANVVKNYVTDFFSQADEVWACSESTSATLRSYGFHGAIRIMENGVEPAPADKLDVFAERARKELVIKDGKPVILFVGQLIWQKNLRVILDALKLVKERSGEYSAVIAGAGYNGQEIREYSEKLGLSDRVSFVGEIDDRELLWGLYRLADLFFFPSVYDNAPLVLREAAQAGTPALLAAGSNAAEPVRDGDNGYIAEPDAGSMAEKLLFILSDPQREEIGRRAQETIPITWDEIVSRADRAYRSINVSEK